eukprot:1784523-Heterocapsa_arctica.AAC.1
MCAGRGVSSRRVCGCEAGCEKQKGRNDNRSFLLTTQFAIMVLSLHAEGVSCEALNVEKQTGTSGQFGLCGVPKPTRSTEPMPWPLSAPWARSVPHASG